MFFNYEHTILAERESVCMGDDCTAPNASVLAFKPDMFISEWLNTVADYVPTMHNVVWSVHSHRKVLGYLIFDTSGDFSIELAVPDQPMSELGISAVFCRYFYEGKLRNDIADNEETDANPACLTLVDKVKQYLRDK